MSAGRKNVTSSAAQTGLLASGELQGGVLGAHLDRPHVRVLGQGHHELTEHVVAGDALLRYGGGRQAHGRHAGGDRDRPVQGRGLRELGDHRGRQPGRRSAQERRGERRRQLLAQGQEHRVRHENARTGVAVEEVQVHPGVLALEVLAGEVQAGGDGVDPPVARELRQVQRRDDLLPDRCRGVGAVHVHESDGGRLNWILSPPTLESRTSAWSYTVVRAAGFQAAARAGVRYSRAVPKSFSTVPGRLKEAR